MKKITMLLRKLSSKFFDTTDTLFTKNYKEISQIIESFPDPKNDLERSKYQYICTMKRSSKFMRFLVNFAALFLIPYYSINSRINSKKINNIDKKDAVFFSRRDTLDLLPNSLKQEYKDIKILDVGKDMALDKETYAFVKQKIFKKFSRPYFNLKVIMKFAMVDYAIQKYNPKAIISYTESSFVTSIISQYCESKGIKYICVMHGERLYGLKFAYFRCTEYYAWDEEYVKLFQKMHCDANKFIVEIPDELKLNNYNKDEKKEFDYTFYLQDETLESLAKYKIIISEMMQKGYKICVRPHPLYMDLVIKEFKDTNIKIQLPRECSLEKSLSVTQFVVSKFSTILYQAWYKGIDIIIDDITMHDIYLKLKDLQYIMFNKKHKLLSQLIDMEV